MRCCSEGMAVRSHGGAVRKLEANQEFHFGLTGDAAFCRGCPSRKSKLSRSFTRREWKCSGRAFVHATVLAAARKLGVDLTAGRKNRTITFMLGNRDTVNEFQSKSCWAPRDIVPGTIGICNYLVSL